MQQGACRGLKAAIYAISTGLEHSDRRFHQKLPQNDTWCIAKFESSHLHVINYNFDLM
jgi:hypothetical protein